MKQEHEIEGITEGDRIELGDENTILSGTVRNVAVEKTASSYIEYECDDGGCQADIHQLHAHTIREWVETGFITVEKA